MLGNGDSPPCIPKHVSCVEASCLLMPSTSLVCSSDVCSAFYFLRAVFEMLHFLQKRLSTAAVVALQLWHHITSHNQGAKAKVKKNQHPSLSFVLGSFWAFCYCRIALLAHVQYTYTMCSDSKGFVWFEISVKTGSLISACAYLIWLDEFDLCWCSPAYLPNLPVESRDISQHYVVRSILDLSEISMMRLFHLSTCLVCVRAWEHVNNIIGKCFSEVKGWRQTGRSTWVLGPGSSECLATISDVRQWRLSSLYSEACLLCWGKLFADAIYFFGL